MDHLNDPAAVLSLILAFGIAAQWIAARLRIPSILLLLLIGFAAGPVFHVIDPDAVFGSLLFPAVELGVAVILFEGALTLKFSDIRGAERVVLRLITVGVAITIGIIGFAAHEILGLNWSIAFLFGAIACVSGPTVIIPLLRAVRPSERVSRILHWEGILIDPIGAVLALIIFEIIIAGQGSAPNPLLALAEVLVIGGLIGAAAGFAMAYILKRHLLPDFLKNVATLAAVLLTFEMANLVANEGGLAAVTVMGLVMANVPSLAREGIIDFKESLSVLLISALFIILAARLDLQSMLALGPAIAALLLVILFIARPLNGFVATIGTDIPWRERTLIGWIAPRGIVAAAVSALFAIRLTEAGVAGASLLVPLTFSVIVATVIVHSLTSRPLAKLLKATSPEASGVLIVGGNPVALHLAEVLNENGIKVCVADASWQQIRKARMKGLPTFFGYAVSELADRQLDLIGLGCLLALSRRQALNALACLRYRTEFGSANVYTVRRDEEAIDKDRETVAFGFRGRLLFNPTMTLERLEEELNTGKSVRVTQISETFTFDQLLEKTGSTDPMLFAISPQGALHPFCEDRTFRIGNGWHVAYLADASNDKPTA